MLDQKIIDLYDEYTHLPLTRSEFLGRLALLTGSTSAAMAMLPIIEVNYEKALMVDPDHQDLHTEQISYPVSKGMIKGYLARPVAEKKYPSVIVVHENRGLNPHIENVTRKLALEGFLALAPDALTPLGGTPTDADSARALIGKLDAGDTLSNFSAAVTYLKGRKDSSGRCGCMGFCWGGGMANQLAVNAQGLDAAVAYYGRQADAADVPRIKAPLLLHYAGMDERINAGIAAYEEALKKAGKTYELYMYDGAQHAFNNDTAPGRYNAAAAQLAWQRTVDFLKKHLA